MARTALTPTALTYAGIAQTLAAANADGHSVVNNGNKFVIVYNGDVSSKTVTVPTPRTARGHAIADDTITVGAGATKIIGPWDPSIYNQDDGTVYINFDAVTSVTIAAFEMPNGF